MKLIYSSNLENETNTQRQKTTIKVNRNCYNENISGMDNFTYLIYSTSYYVNTSEFEGNKVNCNRLLYLITTYHSHHFIFL